uniref:Pancreatic trypsin inhibitor n=1 Tax=Rhipicephalus zambeziensis TaxID=60191 RepID=A0A224Y893_9ACAR
MNRCSSADAHKACSLAYKKIHYRKYGISWPGEMEPRVRGPSSLIDSLNNFTKPTFGFSGEVGRIVESSGVGSAISRPSLITSGPTNSVYGGLPVPAPGLSRLNLNYGHGIPSTGGLGLPGLTTTGSVSSGYTVEEPAGVGPSLLGRTRPGANAPGLDRSFRGGQSLSIPSLSQPGLPGRGLSGSQGTGPTRTLSTSTIGPGATGPHMTVAAGTAPSFGPHLPSSPIIPSIAGSGLSSTMPSGTTPLGSPMPGGTVPVPGTIAAGRTPAAAVERASSLKSPPLTIPSYLLNGF